MHIDEALAAPATEQAGAAAIDKPRLRHLRRPTFSLERRKHDTEIWFLRLIDFYNDVCNGEKAPTRPRPVIRRGIEALDDLLFAVDAGRVRLAKPHPSRPAPTHD